MKIIFVNILVLLFSITVIELFLGKWIDDPDFQEWSCMSKLFHHDYCPEVVWHRTMTSPDPDRTIEVAINRYRLRVASPDMTQGITMVEDFDIINIGDSFMQADEIPFDKTLSAVLQKRSGKKVLQVGYGSWAPIQYFNWLKTNQLKRGVIINVFTFMNDFNPEDDWSNLRYHQRLSHDGLFRKYLLDEDNIFSFLNEINVELRRKSYFVGKLRQLMVLNKSETLFETPVLEEDFSVPQNDCRLLKKYSNIHPRGKDYITFSFDSSCWGEQYFQTVNSAVTDLRKILDLAQKVNGKVNIYLIPASWAFKSESVISKIYPKGGVPHEMSFTTIPLAKYMQEKLEYPVVPLETVIAELKKQHLGDWYFVGDGHWNEFAHKHLGDWLGKNLSNAER